jgi:hypothetical protein
VLFDVILLIKAINKKRIPNVTRIKAILGGYLMTAKKFMRPFVFAI